MAESTAEWERVASTKYWRYRATCSVFRMVVKINYLAAENPLYNSVVEAPRKYAVEFGRRKTRRNTFKAISCRSLTIVPTWIIITNFWLSVFQRTLWPVKWFSKNWRANWIPSSSLQVEDLQHSSMDQFRWQTRLQSWTKLLGHFCIFGSFSNPHRSNPSPHPTNDVGCVCPEFFPSFNSV